MPTAQQRQPSTADLIKQHQAELSAIKETQTADLVKQHQVELENDPVLPKVVEAVKPYVMPILEPVFKGLHQIDRFAGSPLRAAVGAHQRGKSWIEAAKNQFGQDPENAPTDKEIFEYAGLSSKPAQLVPGPLQGFVQKHIAPKEWTEVSPAGLAGAAISTITHPENLFLMKGAFGKHSPSVAGSLDDAAAGLETFAERRAVKAATGQNKPAFQQLTGTTKRGAGGYSKALAKTKESGRILLDEPGLLKPGSSGTHASTVEQLALKTEQSRQMYASKLDEISALTEGATPNAVSADSIKQKMLDYADSIDPAGNGDKLAKRIRVEAKKYDGQLTMKEALHKKQQYKWKEVDKDMLVSDPDVTNRLRMIVDDAMEEAVGNAEKTSPHLKGLLADFKDTKKRFGVFKTLEGAGTDRASGNLSNRVVSPSDYGVGGAAAVTAAAAGSGGASIPAAIAGASFNHILRTRGNAAAARIADGLAQAYKENLKTFVKKADPILTQFRQGSKEALASFILLQQQNPEAYKQLLKYDAMQRKAGEK